ncbi:MAG: hypothetical protein U0610_04395 [bacterium]
MTRSVGHPLMPIPAAADLGTRSAAAALARAALVAASVCAARDAGAATLVEWGDGSFAIDAYRFRLAYASEVPGLARRPKPRSLITEGLDAGLTGEHRLRVEPRLELFGQLSVHAAIDVLDGVLFSDTGDRLFLAYSDQLPLRNELGGQPGQLPRQPARGRGRSPAGTLRFGRQPSHWGSSAWSPTTATATTRRSAIPTWATCLRPRALRHQATP